MTAQPPTTIAVFAATGSQGGAVTDALLAKGAHVRALLRDTTSGKAQALAGRGVELVEVDTDDGQSLTTALRSVDAFWFMTVPPGGMQNPDIDGEVQQGIALANAAAAAQVPHTVFSSVGGADRDSRVPHFDSKYRVEEHLATLDLHTTIIRPVFFIENFYWFAPATEAGTLVVRLPLPDDIKLQVISVRDVGIIAAAALLDSSSVPSAIEIAGDEVTGGDIAAAFAEKTGMQARYEALPLAVLDGQSDMQSMFRWLAETPAYQADLNETRRIDPDALTLQTWLAASNYVPAS